MLAFRALPLIIVISALTAVLTYWRILPWIVRGLALVLEKSLGVGGAVGLGTAANAFVGMVKAPLFIRPYLAALSRSELIMTYAMCGFANFGSLGILIGGPSTMVPERRDEAVGLVLRSILAGTLATCCTGAVVGILLP